ncbi:MAG: hypothetical protein M1827_006140 [Pycnora praestabilis]|nr:MAG: hypothetical protein M1827_006140 [Pycnora praestabilis]
MLIFLSLVIPSILASSAQWIFPPSEDTNLTFSTGDTLLLSLTSDYTNPDVGIDCDGVPSALSYPINATAETYPWHMNASFIGICYLVLYDNPPLPSSALSAPQILGQTVTPLAFKGSGVFTAVNGSGNGESREGTTYGAQTSGVSVSLDPQATGTQVVAGETGDAAVATITHLGSSAVPISTSSTGIVKSDAVSGTFSRGGARTLMKFGISGSVIILMSSVVL